MINLNVQKGKISKNIFNVFVLRTHCGLLSDREQRNGGAGMNQFERRQRLLEVLCLRRHDTYDNLAKEFHVSKMTIRRDITELSCSYPIETVCGRYGGGIKVSEGYMPYRKTLNEKQISLLIRLSAGLEGDDLATMSSIIFQLAP